MSGCAYDQLLDAYHDGELSDPQRTEIESHLAACPACTAELERLRSISRELSDARSPHLTEMDKARLRQLTAVEARRLANKDGRWARWLTAAAAAIFFVSVTQIVWRYRHNGGVDDPTQIRVNDPVKPSVKPLTTPSVDRRGDIE